MESGLNNWNVSSFPKSPAFVTKKDEPGLLFFTSNVIPTEVPRLYRGVKWRNLSSRVLGTRIYSETSSRIPRLTPCARGSLGMTNGHKNAKIKT